MKEDVLKHIPNIDQATTVTTLDAASLTPKMFIKEYVAKNRPCLIKNAIKHWPALKNWQDTHYLTSLCGEHDTTYYPHMNYDNADNMQQDETKACFANVLDLLQQEEATNNDIISMPSVLLEREPFNTLAKDMSGFRFLPTPKQPLNYPSVRAFFYKGAGTGWHFHFADETLMSQVVGCKIVGLLPPDTQTDNLVYDAFTSDAYLENSNCFSAEAYNVLKPMIAHVEVGDALYIPPFWWHGVKTVDDKFGITVASCWRSPLHVMGNLSYPTVRKIWKKALTRPNKNTFFVILFGSLSLFSQGMRALIHSHFK